MDDIKVVRTGLVQYLAGYEQNSREVGSSPVYRSARVEELSDGTILYYPPTAAVRTTDGGCEMPAELIPGVAWDAE